MIFYRGRPPKCEFKLGQKNLELVNNFTYLGFNITTQLSFSKHLESITMKANSRCGMLMTRLPLRNLPINIVLKVWDCYVLPIFRYGLPLYFSSCSNSSLKTANSSFTKFLKSYLGIPYYSNNSITHFITETCPLINTLENLIPHSLGSLTFPPEFNGYKLTFLNSYNTTTYNPVPEMPTFFWRSKIFYQLPTSKFYRKKLCREIFDLDHDKLCQNQKFHFLDENNCKCIGCNETMNHYHKYDCKNYSHA